MSDDIKLITPEQRLERLPFEVGKTSAGETSGKVRLEDYDCLPSVDLKLPPMDHHLLILNYAPPAAEVKHQCGEIKANGCWQKNAMTLVPALWDNTWLIPESDTAALHVLLPDHFVRKIADETMAIDPSQLEMTPFFDTQDPVLQNLSLLMLKEIREGFTNGELYLESLATATTVHLLKDYSNQQHRAVSVTGRLSRSGLSKLLNYIDENISASIKLDAMASQLCMSAYHFSRAFKQTTGYSPHQFVILRRANFARLLLAKKEGLSIAQIAQAAGFTDQSHMNKTLKSVFNKTAKTLREEG